MLGFLYWLMIKRETPERIGAFQALLPLTLGIVFFLMGAFGTVMLAKATGGLGAALSGSTSFGSSLLHPFSWLAIRKRRQSCS